VGLEGAVAKGGMTEMWCRGVSPLQATNLPCTGTKLMSGW
jgi:hypothetical protein